MLKKMLPCRLGIVIFLLLFGHLAEAAPYDSAGQATATWRAEWRDAKRDRKVPVTIYYPTAAGPFPVVVFSHGLGGTRDMYEYLGTYWAANGYVAVHLQHIGSDDAVWRNGAGRAGMRDAMTLKNVTDRPRDVSFALDQLTTLNVDPDWPLRGKLDLQKVGMAGHSFGANTTLLISGARPPAGAASLADPRVKCAIALSSPPPMVKEYAEIYENINIPMLHMTGTKDTTMLDRAGSTPLDRRIPYDNIGGSDGYLVTFTDGDHMVFSGRNSPTRKVASDARNHLLIQQSTTAFWDAYLKADTKALAWLRDDFGKELGQNGVFEQKKPK